MATFGSIASANPNVLFDPARAMGAAQQYKQNELLMQHRQQDQQAQTFERDATARISLARQMADLPDDVLATEWGPAVQRLQAAGLGQGINPSKPPPRERLRQIAASDLTTFQRLQIDEQRRQTEALGGLATGGGAPAQASVPSVPGAAPGAAPAAPAGGGGQAPAGAPVRPFVAQNLPEGVDVETDQLVRTVLGEAGGEDDRGQMAVVGVIGNRAKQSGMDTTGVIFAPKQFEPWNNPQVRARLEAIDPASPAYQRALANVRKVRSGLEPDPTGGATHFYSPTAQAGLGRPPPSWDNGKGVDLGRHRFFSLGYGPGSGAPGAPPGQQQAGVPAPQPTPPGGVAARTPGATDMAGPGVPQNQPQRAPGYTDPRTLGLPEQDDPSLFAPVAAPPQQVAAVPQAPAAPVAAPSQNALAPPVQSPQQALPSAPADAPPTIAGEPINPRSGFTATQERDLIQLRRRGASPEEFQREQMKVRQHNQTVLAQERNQPLVPVPQPDGSTKFVPRAQAVGMVGAPAPDNTLVEVSQPDGSKRFVRRSEAAGQTSAAPPTVDTFGRANTLRDEHKSLTGEFRNVQTAWTNIQQASKSNTGAGDMAMLYSFIKLLDPNTGVKDAEYQAAALSGSYGERIQGAFQRALTGERLPDSLRQAFVAEAKTLYTTQRRGYDHVSKQYRDMAVRHGLKPEDVVPDYVTPGDAAGAGGGSTLPPLPPGSKLVVK
jgi:hypothetical protein